METAILVKKVLFKSFIYGFVLLIISSLLYMFRFDAMYEMVRTFYPISQDTLMYVVLIALSVWKVTLIQFFLFPAIALHCTIKSSQKKEA